MTRAVFFDKDGVLSPDNGISGSIECIQLYPNSGKIVSYCREREFKTFLITNQAIVARGIIDEQALISYLQAFQLKILEQSPKAELDKIYFCPHHPNANVKKYRTNCSCRKPKPGMLLSAAQEYEIDMKNSFMIGDRLSDIIAGKLAGVKTIQCLTGRHNDKMIETDLDYEETIKPDFIIKALDEIRTIIK
jgi:D-glycero-D-manno-heptose 1,7-bisphosphate phosphatase